MWHIIKAELKYYRIAISAPIFYTILFQIGEFFISKTITGMENAPANNESANIGDGFYSFVIIFTLFSVWQTRIKEKRNRLFALLPLTSKQFAQSRFWFAIIPISILLIYFVISHLIVNNVWHIELSIPIIHIGILLIIVAGFIRARDDWFSHWNFGKRTQAAFISVSIIQIIVVAIFLGLPNTYNNSDFGLNVYAVLIFFLLGLVIMLTTIYSYQKRKSYLS